MGNKTRTFGIPVGAIAGDGQWVFGRLIAECDETRTDGRRRCELRLHDRDDHSRIPVGTLSARSLSALRHRMTSVARSAKRYSYVGAIEREFDRALARRRWIDDQGDDLHRFDWSVKFASVAAAVLLEAEFRDSRDPERS